MSYLGNSPVPDESVFEVLLDTKADVVHEHVIADMPGLQTVLDGKASSGHSHTTYASLIHGHAITDVIGLQNVLDTKASTSYVDNAVTNANVSDMVTLSTQQTVTGEKTFTENLWVVRSSGQSLTGAVWAGSNPSSAYIFNNSAAAGLYDSVEGPIVFSAKGANGTTLNARSGGILRLTIGEVEKGIILPSGDLVMTGNVTGYSDIRLKTDLTKISKPLDIVDSLTGYTYTRTDTGKKETGLVAQDVLKVLPEAVIEGEYMSVAYGNMVGLLVEAIKELRKEINELKGVV